MSHKLIVRFMILVLLSLLVIPMSGAQAQEPDQTTPPECLPYNYDAFYAHDAGFLRSLPPGCAKAYRTSTPESGRAVLPEAAGGPDNFGYTWNDAVSFNWIDATAGTNTGLSGYDDATGLVTLPFSFKYYENTYNRVYITASGYLTFTYPSYWDNQQNIPSSYEPNNVIAPYWTPMYIGPGAWVHYKSGGSAPNRYFVVEWHDVTGDAPGGLGADEKYRFEAILYESGDIVFQYKTMTYAEDYWCGESGLEDMAGLDGLSYVGFCNQVPANKAVHFYRPAVSVKVTPAQQGGFTQAGATKSFQINVRNPGDSGTDTYDLTSYSAWPVALYGSNGSTLLTDTDADGTIDTGPIAEGASKNIVAKFSVPGFSQLGDGDYANLIATSSLDPSKYGTASLSMGVPTSFVNVFEDDDNGAMSLMTVSSSAVKTYAATSNSYYGYDVAVTKLVNDNYLYAWSKSRNTGSFWVSDIEYAILDSKGTLVRPVTKLTNNSSASIRTYDYAPTIAVAPNGTIGIAWDHYLYNPATSSFNYNIYFATLNGSGSRLTGPTNLTNNSAWNTGDDNVPYFFSPTIAATDDNRFILGWEKYLNTPSSYSANIWYAVRNTGGASVIPPTAVTGNNRSFSPVLNSLSGGKAILTWYSNVAPNYGTPTYAVLKSSGGLAKSATTLGVNYVYETADAVLLGNNKVAVAWPTYSGVQLAILNSSYVLESGPSSANSPGAHEGYGLSLTTDSANRAIMTWLVTDKILVYALGDSSGSFITYPMIYESSASYVSSSYNGQGSAPYRPSYTVSGDLGIGNTVLNYTGGSVKANSSGDYSFKVLAGWSGAVTPTHACFTFDPVNKSYSNVESNQTGQDYQPLFNAASGCADIDVSIGGSTRGRFGLLPHTVTRPKFSGLNSGPVQISSNNLPLVASQRVIYGGVSYSEMMGLPLEQLTDEYLFPYYNNVAMDSQLRVSNLGNVPTTITVYLAGNQIDSYTLAAGAATKLNYAGQNSGPLRVTSSDTSILATMRVLYGGKSYSELMGFPADQLTDEYLFPYYNNVAMDSQLRVSNVGGADTTITVYLGTQQIDSYPLLAGAATRKNYAGQNGGPLRVSSSDSNILTTIRVLYGSTSYSELMGFPSNQLAKEYWYPVYDNVALDSQLRVSNVGVGPTTITVYAGGVQIDTYPLAAGAATRKNYAGKNTGPLQVVSSAENILTTIRMLYGASLYEMTGLPNTQLSTAYYFPWYNNTAMNSELRFAVP